ncbi:MAG: hypothetical protein IJN13_00480 [Bacilli bacterium]|nr:hypothetical protein [Bacilli bacterium]
MAIIYGMSVKEFWEDSPDLFWAYRFSYFERVKIEQKIFNGNAWLQGAYIYESVSVALNNSFSKQKRDYSKVPYGFEKNELENLKNQSDATVAKLKNRVLEIQNLFKSSTTNQG